MKQDVTIVDIAKKAGVSTATVSRVLNGTERVRSGTREKVEAAMREMNYRPNLIARNMGSVTNDMIGVLVSDVRDPFCAKIFVECEKYANEKGFSLLLCNFRESEELELRYYDLLMAQRVCAIIHIGGSVDRRKTSLAFYKRLQDISERIPVITSTRIEGTKCRCVHLDHARGMELLMEHLLSLGHEKIAFAGGQEEVYSTWEKIQSYRKIMRRRKIRICPYYISESVSCDRLGGYLAARKILEGDSCPTAVIAVNDLAAIGVIEALEEYGLKVGEQVSVASFDNTYIAEMLSPELTSVSSDYSEYAKRMIDLVIAANAGEEGGEIQDIPMELVQRESCTQCTS